MSLSTAIAVAEARSYLGVLAGHAASAAESSAYEASLHYLDSIYPNVAPALDTRSLVQPTDVLHSLAMAAIEDLTGRGIDALQVELLLAMVEDARIEPFAGDQP